LWALGVRELRKLAYISAITLFSLLGCTTAYFEKYVPKDIAVDPSVSVERTAWNEIIYKQGEYRFFPRFYTLSKSYSKPGALLVISSATRKKVFLESVTLESQDRQYRDIVEYKKEIPLDRYNEEEGRNYIGLPVFGIENTDLSKYWDAGDIRVILSYREGGELQILTFEFKLRTGREIVWPT